MRTPDDRARLHVTPEELRARRRERLRKRQRQQRRSDTLTAIAIIAWAAILLFWTALILTGAFLAVRWLWLETM